MLILTRQVGQGIVINENVHIKIMAKGRSQIRIGIEAPRECSIYRTELLEELPPATDKELDTDSLEFVVETSDLN